MQMKWTVSVKFDIKKSRKFEELSYLAEYDFVENNGSICTVYRIEMFCLCC